MSRMQGTPCRRYMRPQGAQLPDQAAYIMYIMRNHVWELYSRFRLWLSHSVRILANLSNEELHEQTALLA